MGVADIVRVSTFTFICLSFSFTATSEFLFLVDNQKPEIVEFHIFPDELVGSYDNIYFAVGEVFQKAFTSEAFRARLRYSIRTGNSFNRSLKVW